MIKFRFFKTCKETLEFIEMWRTYDIQLTVTSGGLYQVGVQI